MSAHAEAAAHVAGKLPGDGPGLGVGVDGHVRLGYGRQQLHRGQITGVTTSFRWLSVRRCSRPRRGGCFGADDGCCYPTAMSNVHGTPTSIPVWSSTCSPGRTTAAPRSPANPWTTSTSTRSSTSSLAASPTSPPDDCTRRRRDEWLRRQLDPPRSIRNLQIHGIRPVSPGLADSARNRAEPVRFDFRGGDAQPALCAGLGRDQDGRVESDLPSVLVGRGSRPTGRRLVHRPQRNS
jgi:hypothetical protein